MNSSFSALNTIEKNAKEQTLANAERAIETGGTAYIVEVIRIELLTEAKIISRVQKLRELIDNRR